MRPSGNVLETNGSEATIKYCESLGFENMAPLKPKESTKVIEPVKPDSVTKKKAGRPKKVVAD
jgi:hypothetical protein